MPQKNKISNLKQLGDLETDVMGVVWEKGRVTVQEVKDALEPRRSLAYTTIMTVLARLAEKGILERHKDGRAYFYTPASSHDKMAGSLLRSLVQRLYDGATGKAIAHLLEEDDAVDDAELERLEDLIRRRRQEKHS
ncbi:MAG: BlaI/MecI/CopY family transcriptional regulator [Anaerolineaceae bacterium]|nr:BlaI/MecI/CopY family transcriptional regulator [Anaerolineaceae bacterium]